MTRRTYTWNAYESKLTAELNPDIGNASVESALGLLAPVYLCIDPDKPDSREWIKVLSITGNSFDTMDRGLPGSIGDVGHGTYHAPGAIVRAVFTKQLQDDIFDDIKDLEDLTDDLPGNYLRLDGTNAMTEALHLSSGAPTATWEATNKLYVDDQDNKRIPYTGATMEGGFDMVGLYTIANLPTPVAAGDAVPLSYLQVDDQDKWLPLSGGVMSGEGDIQMTGAKITGLGIALNDDDALSIAAANDLYVELAGDVMSGPLTVDELNVSIVRALSGDLTFKDIADDTVLYYDESTKKLEYLRLMDLNDNTLMQVKDPSHASHVGDMGFNDLRYVLEEGDAMSGPLVLPDGTAAVPSL
ncbi:MAG: hypothetical protein DRH08_12335, partial [Deltaproteobacteria bacterium]